ncbi:MAG TPA: GatB/YqeY domain-containing protein [Dehalococcoidia bacterium]|nr:GatB/YqeY domain-containing protein [Dehalococcoidia bacterium]
MKEKLTGDLKKAMKGGDNTKRSVVRMIMSAIKNAEIAKRSDIEDSDILGIIAKEAKVREESIEAFKQGNRQDLVDQQEAELAILQEYLPKKATREEIIEAARAVIAEVGAEGPHDKGKVMPALIAKFKGKADGRDINEAVTELLS